MSHGHGHDGHHGPTPKQSLLVALVLNGAFLLLEATVGWWTNSLALMADAGHMVSDVGALLVAFIAVRLRERRPSEHYTFGLQRAPVLGGLLNGISLVVIVVFIGIEAIERMDSPPPMEAVAVLWMGSVGLFVNLGSAWYLARSRDQSVNTRGAMLHLLSDALGSVAAIVSAVAVLVWSFPLADPIASIVIAALILLGSLPLLRDTVLILLQRAPSGLELEPVRACILETREVRSVEDLHLWELDSGQPVLSAILVVDRHDLEPANRVADELRLLLIERFAIKHATLECRHRRAENCAPDLGY